MEARIGERPVCESCKTGNGFKARAIVVEPTARVEVEKRRRRDHKKYLKQFSE
jgi:hypothetical protein